MRNTLYAAAAASMAMLATSGIVAWATAAPQVAIQTASLEQSEAAFARQLDTVIARQLIRVKERVLAHQDP